jgi:hypothetical protein
MVAAVFWLHVVASKLIQIINLLREQEVIT